MRIVKIALICLLFTGVALGLGQRLAVQYIRAIAVDLELTPPQVESLTKQQVATYILDNHPEIPIAKLKEAATYFLGIKEMLMHDAIERQTVNRLVLFKTQIESVYPDAVGLQTAYAKDIARRLLPLLYGEVDPNDI